MLGGFAFFWQESVWLDWDQAIQLTAPQWISGYCWWGSLTNPMLITALLITCSEVHWGVFLDLEVSSMGKQMQYVILINLLSLIRSFLFLNDYWPCKYKHEAVAYEFIACGSIGVVYSRYMGFRCMVIWSLINKRFLCIILVDWHPSDIHLDMSLLFSSFFLQMSLWLFWLVWVLCFYFWLILFQLHCLYCNFYGWYSRIWNLNWVFWYYLGFLVYIDLFYYF